MLDVDRSTERQGPQHLQMHNDAALLENGVIFQKLKVKLPPGAVVQVSNPCTQEVEACRYRPLGSRPAWSTRHAGAAQCLKKRVVL